MGWVTRAPMPTARYGLAAGVVGSTLYAVGGITSTLTDVNEAYDPSTDTWASRAAMPTSRYGLAAGVVDSTLYAVGGAGPTAANEAYDPSTDIWASRAAMPTSRQDFAAGVVGSTLYAVGGYTGAGPTDVNEAYGPSTDTWSSQAAMPTARDGLAAGVVGSTLYAVGGYTGAGPTDVNEAYDPSTDTWASRASMPTARDRLAAGVVDSTLYAVGGWTTAWTAVNEAYDPSTDTWSSQDPMPTARYYLAAGVVDSTLYAVGGLGELAWTAVNEAYTLPPPTGTVTGTVRDAATLQPLMGVTVSSDDGQATTTESDGSYTLADVTAGTRTITFSAADYNPRIEIITVPEGGTYTLNVDLVPAVQQRASADIGPLAVTERSRVRELYQVTSRDTAPLAAADRTGALAAEVVVSEAASLAAMETPAIAADLAAADAADLAVSETPAVDAAVAGTRDAVTLGADEGRRIRLHASDAGALGIVEQPTLHVVEIADEHRVVIQVADRNGVPLGPGPIVNVLACEYQLALDEIGSVRFEVPATDERADLIQTGREIAVIREGEGVVFRGVIRSAEAEVDASGAARLVVEGDSRAVELLWANTLLGRAYEGVPPAAAVDDLLSGTGWTRGSVGSGPTVSTRFDGASIWAALRTIAQTYGWHLREDNLSRRVDLEEVGAPSGLVLTQVEQAAPDLAVVPLTQLTIREEQAELWNRIIPLGAGEGINALTLEHAERSAPYPIQEGTGPDGQPYWYLEDAASIAAHGARTRVLKVEDAAPISNSEAEIVAAANALYDVAAAWLAWHAHPAEFYTAEVVGLRHLDPVTGQPRFQVGQTARLQWRGIVADERGRRLWRVVDADVYLMGVRREFADSGADRWQLELATIDQHAPGAADGIVRAIEDLWAVQTALKPYTYREVHGPQRQSLDGSNPVRFVVDFDDNVTYLHSARLQLSKLRLRANARTAAAGGGATSSGGSAHSHSVSGQTAQSGGGATSSAGAAHSHTIGGTTTQSDGAPHGHPIGQMLGAVEPWTDPAYKQVLVFDDAQGNAFGVWVGRETTNQPVGSFWTRGYTTHTHGISGMATQTEASHTHQTPNHTHAVSGTTTSADTSHTHQVPAHTHPLEYGIYEGPNASAPQFRILINGVDRTSELGGPWNGDATLDITRYLVDTRGLLVRRQNVIEIRGSQLTDVELTCKSLVSATALVPV